MEITHKGKEQETPEQAKVRRGAVTFRPRKNNVLVDVIEIKTVGKILMPEGVAPGTTLESFHDHPFQGIVVALGPDFGRMPLGNTGEVSADDLRIGQRVAFRVYPGTGIRHEGHTYNLIADHDVIGILE